MASFSTADHVSAAVRVAVGTADPSAAASVALASGTGGVWRQVPPRPSAPARRARSRAAARSLIRSWVRAVPKRNSSTVARKRDPGIEILSRRRKIGTLAGNRWTPSGVEIRCDLCDQAPDQSP